MDNYKKPEVIKAGESDESLMGFAAVLDTELFVAFVAFVAFVIEGA
jgi:hypothetical protein